MEAVDEVAGDARPDFHGVNCSHPVEFEPALVPGPWLERIRSLRPNAALAEKQALCRIGHLEAIPRRSGRTWARWRGGFRSHVWGGCCGIWDDHLGAIARHLPRSVDPVAVSD